MRFNGIEFQGMRFNGIKLEGIKLQGQANTGSHSDVDSVRIPLKAVSPIAKNRIELVGSRLVVIDK